MRVNIAGYRPKHLSWSTYDGYAGCGERQRLQKVLQLEQRPGWASLGGTAVHNCVETIEKMAWDHDIPIDEWRGNFDYAVMFAEELTHAIADTAERSPSFKPEDFYASPNRGKPKNHTWWLEEGPRMVARWVEWRKRTRWTPWVAPGTETPAVELELNFTLPGDHPVKGFIDSVWVLPTGKLAVLDVKTGRQPDSAGQLGLYRVGLKTLFDVDVDWGFFWLATKGEHTQPVPLLQYDADYYANLMDAAVRGHNAGVFLPKPQNNCREWCGTARYCAAVGGELAHTVPSLTEMLTLSGREDADV